MEYPSSHPKHEELKALKLDMDIAYQGLKINEDEARTAYTEAIAQLRTMGDCLKRADEHRKFLVDGIKKLEALAVEPLI